jgi:pantoate--beta-alanine ligase
MSQSSDAIAFVPTMGALHAGHLELIKRARDLAPRVVVSIFVNPLQFESAEDLAKYPRDLAGDKEKALSAGATEVWAPEYEEIYPGEISKISAGAVGETFEGSERVGHFDGMLTVVSRLFEIVKPTYAIFGEKDFQQLFIVRRWARESGSSVEINSLPTVRDADGLALSSRNQRLSSAGRQSALVINRALLAPSLEAMREVLVQEPGFTLDYLEIIDEDTFEPATERSRNRRAIIAGWVEGVRLIDNMAMKTLTEGARA